MNLIITLWKKMEKSLIFSLNKILNLNLSEQTINNLIQFIKFGIVGLSNTVIGYLIYAVSLKALRILGYFQYMDIYIAQLVMFLLSVLWSFYWNNKAVFQKKEEEQRNLFVSLIKTYATYAFTSLVLSEILLHIWVNKFGISEYISPIINLLITVPLNFLIQKYWAFRA